MENLREENIEIANINYNVFNALNLYNEELGQSYVTTGFNPFGENFELGEEYITDVLHNKNQAKEIKSPEFIEKGDKACKQAFENSLVACENLLNELMGKLNSAELTPEQKAKLSKIIAFLQMRIQLLKIYIEKLKTEKNKLKLYQNLLALNWSFADLMEETYKENCDLFALINKILQTTESAKNVQAEQENAKLREEARQIIANNIKAMQKESAEVEQENPYIQAMREMKASETQQSQNNDLSKANKQAEVVSENTVKVEKEPITSTKSEQEIER